MRAWTAIWTVFIARALLLAIIFFSFAIIDTLNISFLTRYGAFVGSLFAWCYALSYNLLPFVKTSLIGFGEFNAGNVTEVIVV